VDCDQDYYSDSKICLACPDNTYNVKGDIIDAVTTCNDCGENFHVVSGVCTACTAGQTRAHGDPVSGPDTRCTTSCKLFLHVAYFLLRFVNLTYCDPHF
jgi:hypothetical protein